MAKPTDIQNFRRTKIICTLGPATDSTSMIEKLADAGMNCARLNFSHGTHGQHKKVIGRIRKVSKKIGREIGIIQDLPGPKLRVGKLKNGDVYIRKGSTVSITTDDIIGDEKRIPVKYARLLTYVRSGTSIFLADGSIRLRVSDTSDSEIKCKCEIGGELLAGKGVNIPDLQGDFETFTEADKKHLRFGLENGVDFVAISFVRNASDVRKVRRFTERNMDNSSSSGRPFLIAKIEKKEAVDDIQAIVNEADAIMVARGDLGVENPLERVPIIQKSITSICNQAALPVITATQILESMVNNLRPTRAEVSDIASAINEGTDALMLSEETAVGKNPVACVEMLNRVAVTVERKMRSDLKHALTAEFMHESIQDAVSEAANQISLDIGAKLLVCPTNSTDMAPRISRFRPKAPVVAMADDRNTIRKLLICWGVYPIEIRKTKDLTQLLDASVNRLVKERYVQEGDRMVIVCDDVGLSEQKGTLLFVSEH